MTTQLTFNGINALTGDYGLPPMTGAELAAHITGGAPGQATALEAGLDQDRAAALAGLTGWLAASALEDGPRDDAWRNQWIATLARKLADVLSAGVDAAPERSQALEDQLARQPVETLETVVSLLLQGKTAELAALLPGQDEAEDKQPEALAVHALKDAERWLAYIREELLTTAHAEALTGNRAAQDAWLDALIVALRLAWPAFSSAGVRRPVDMLGRACGALARNHPPCAWLETLRAALQTAPTDAAWDAVLHILHAGLAVRITAHDEVIPWSELLANLAKWLTAIAGSRRVVAEHIDPTDLAQAGWGVIFPAYAGPRALPTEALKEALAPLLTLRQSQAGERFRVYEGVAGYRPNDTAASFLSRYGAVPSDPVDPCKAPYYLLLVGNPEDIPFSFQYQLDVQYAVGRIDFADLEAYAHYARSVVAAEAAASAGAETGALQRPPTATFFGVANPGDTATTLSATYLVSPLAAQLQARYPAWQMHVILREAATKARLARLLGADAPALLFAAGHGMEFPPDAPHQRPHQGALLCQDWPGPNAWRGAIPQDFYLAGDDVSATANLTGLIAFFFACYSAGTPRFDEYTRATFRQSGAVLAERPFVAALPQALLSRPQGGALAVIGHVERAWGSSFLDTQRNEQIAVFASTLERLLKGQPLGLAMEYFNGRYAALSTELTATLERYALPGAAEDPYELKTLQKSGHLAKCAQYSILP